MKTIRLSIFAALSTLLVACAAIGLATPKTFNERLAGGYTAVTTVRQTTLTLLQANKISVSDAENVQKQADNARAGLDLARTLPRSLGESKLESTLAILNSLETYLSTRKNSP